MLYTGSLWGAASGSAGGMTWSRNRYGTYCRQRRTPVNPGSPAQENARNLFRDAVVAWTQSLTNSSRADWVDYANSVPWLNRIGVTVYLTGQAHFIRSYTAWALRTGTPMTTFLAPTVYNLGDIGVIEPGALSAGTGELTLNIDGSPQWSQNDTGGLLVEAGLPQNSSRSFYGGPWRYIGQIEGDAMSPPTTGVITFDTVDSRFIPQLGAKQWFRVSAQQSDKRLSTKLKIFQTATV